MVRKWRGARKLPDRLSSLLFDLAVTVRGGEHDGQVRFDGLALVVADGAVNTTADLIDSRTP